MTTNQNEQTTVEMASRPWVRVWRVRTMADRLPAVWAGRPEAYDRALQSQIEASAIGCAGPGIGNVREQRLYSPSDIGSAVAGRMTLALPADIVNSVTALVWRMLPGDLVLLWGHQRAALVEITGEYQHDPNETEAFKAGYDHRRPVRVLSTEASAIVFVEEMCGSFDGDYSHMILPGRREVDAAHIHALVRNIEDRAEAMRIADAERAKEMARQNATAVAMQAAQAAQAVLHEQQRVRERAVEALRAAEAAAAQAAAEAEQKAQEAKDLAAKLSQ